MSETRISQARTVLQFAREFVDGVLANTKSLNEAYAEAQKRRQAKEKFDDRVEDADKLTLNEARAILSDRDKEAQAVRDSVFMGLADLCRNHDRAEG